MSVFWDTCCEIISSSKGKISLTKAGSGKYERRGIMMNERAYNRNYEADYVRNYYRGGTSGRDRMYREKRNGNGHRDMERMSFYETYQIPLMILGSFLSGVLLIVGALA